MYNFPSISQLCTTLRWTITYNPNRIHFHLWLKCDNMWKISILLQGTLCIKALLFYTLFCKFDQKL